MIFNKTDDVPAFVSLPTHNPSPKRILLGSPQQELFWAELAEGSTSVCLEARAGTGKSSSCREGMWRLLAADKNLDIRYCCFNKSIADEFRRDCPPAVDVGTMHRFGLAALKAEYPRVQVEQHKTYSILDSIPGGAVLKRYTRRAISQLVSLAKNHAYGPDVEGLDKLLLDLIWQFDIETYRQDMDVVEWACDVLQRSAERTSLIDFDDMLWLPVIHELSIPTGDLLFIDEAQDLNPIQHELAERLAGAGRTVIVGDPYQAIYGWRGAAPDSIGLLRDRLDCKTLFLTVTWRCPRSHVDLAQRYVPDFEAAPEAALGTIIQGGQVHLDNARPGDLILCRTNAPLIAACLERIARREPAVVRGRAIGDDLTKVSARVERSFRGEDIPGFLRGLAAWRAQQTARLEAVDGMESKIEQLYDQTDALQAISSTCDRVAQIPNVIADLFSDDDAGNRVTFSTIHRAKGSEAKRVACIDVPYSVERDRKKPPDQAELQQRSNLAYVAVTRSLDTLTLISDPKGN